MKIYSDSAVTQSAVNATVQEVVTAAIDSVDAKQTEQIQKLRWWLAGATAFNVILSLNLFLFLLNKI